MKPKRPAARSRSRGPVRLGARLEKGALHLPGERGGSREVPLLAGAVHYWRLERSAWRDALTETGRLGLPIIETYVPWQVHETASGEHDFGRLDPRKDLGAFLDLVGELGLLAFVRPGPHINSEMTYFGLPERIVFDRAMQARSPKGSPVVLAFPPRMFPVPSYASRAYHDEVGRWLDAVGEVVAPRLWPQGPVVLLQVDNEGAYWFRDGAYDQDYHPDALAEWRTWIEARHGSVAECGRAHGRSYDSWDEVRAPERFDLEDSHEALGLHLDWALFREELIAGAIARFKARFQTAGLSGVPTVHNLPLGEQAAPLSASRLEGIVDVVGLDFYHARREHRTIKRRALWLAGTSRLPFAPEMGVGAPPWFTPLTHDDSLFCAMTAAAYGVRGMSLYMAVDRDRWYGAPIDSRGNPRLESGAWRAFLHALVRTRFHRLRRRVEVGLVLPREYARLSRATHLLGPISPVTVEAVTGTPALSSSEETLGFPGPIQVLWWKMIARIADALAARGVPYVYLDGDAPAERLEGLRVLVTPSYELASPERWKGLCAWAAGGGTAVFGPAMPSLDECMRRTPFEVPRGGRRVSIDGDADAERIVDELVRDLSLDRPFVATPAPIETAVHEDDAGPAVLFVVNPALDPIEASITLPFPLALEDVMSEERFDGENAITLSMAPGSCRMFTVTRTASAARAGIEAS